MKKLLILCLTLSLAIGSCGIAMAQSEVNNFSIDQKDRLETIGIDINECNSLIEKGMSADQIMNFIELGFTLQEIGDFTESEMERFSKSKGELIGTDIKYYKIQSGKKPVELSKDQVLKELSTYKLQQQKLDNQTKGDGGTSFLQLSTSVSKVYGYKHYFFKTSFEWLSSPWYYGNDVLGMTNSQSINVDDDSEYFMLKYDYMVNGQVVDAKRVPIASATEKDVGVVAFKFDMKFQENNYTCSNHRGYMSYYGHATPTTYVGNSNAFGKYWHQKVSCSVGIGISPFAITVTPTTKMEHYPDSSQEFKITE